MRLSASYERDDIRFHTIEHSRQFCGRKKSHHHGVAEINSATRNNVLSAIELSTTPLEAPVVSTSSVNRRQLDSGFKMISSFRYLPLFSAGILETRGSQRTLIALHLGRINSRMRTKPDVCGLYPGFNDTCIRHLLL